MTTGRGIRIPDLLNLMAACCWLWVALGLEVTAGWQLYASVLAAFLFAMTAWSGRGEWIRAAGFAGLSFALVMVWWFGVAYASRLRIGTPWVTSDAAITVVNSLIDTRGGHR